MAVNPQKLLPPAKLSPAERMAAAYDKKIDDLLNIKIKKKLINVDKVLNKTTEKKEKIRKNKRKNVENEERKKKEERLEKNKSQAATKLNLPGLPRTGFLDSIQNFIGYTFLGYLMTNYYDKLPALMGVVKVLPAAMETFGNIVTTTVDFTASFIKGGYEFRDYVSQKKGEVDGPEAQKRFDEATDGLKNMINSIMTLGLYQAPKKEKQPIPQKTNGGYVRKMAPGGNVTRAGKPVGGAISRQIQKVETKTFPIVYRQVSQPGKDIGGRQKIETIFPASPKRDEPGPLNTLMNTSSELGKIPFIGPLMGAAIDIAMGQKPDKRIYTTFGQSLAYMLGPSIEAQSNTSIGNIVSTIAAMAEGGAVSRGITKKKTNAQELGFALANLFQVSVEGRLSKIFSEILRTKSYQEPSPTAGAVTVESGSPDFWLLAVASLLENSDPQGAADVAQVIYNRVASPAWPGDIRSVIMAGNGAQFQPVRDYGNIGAWNSIKSKESAISFIEKYGKGRTQSQLEQVAAALLDPARQKSAATFVGPRDSFRAISFEDKYNHLANETEQRRHGHAFGFEPGGAQISAFKAGKLTPAQVSASTTGTVTSLSSQLTGENGKLKPSQLTKVGTLYGTVDYKDWYGNGAYLRHDAARAFLAAKAQAQKEGITILITSAYRSLAHQQALQGIYNVVAQPGTSRHGEGTALDIQTGTRGYDWFVQNGPSYGWHYMAIPGDPVHFEYLGGYKPKTSVKKQEKSSTNIKPPELNVASAKSSVTNTAQQLAMTPSYAQEGGGTTFVLKEKIILKEVPGSQSSPSSASDSIQFPGLNSTTPTFIG